MMNMRAIHNNFGKGKLLIYEDKPGDIYAWINQGQDIESVMFGTGFGKEKFGREIFAGDIVTIDKTVRLEISYEPEMFMFIAMKEDFTGWYNLKDIIKQIDGIVGTIHDAEINDIVNS